MPDETANQLSDEFEQPLRALQSGDGSQTAVTIAAGSSGEIEAFQILLQASAAAESLQQRFADLQQRRSELIAEQSQLQADRSAFELRAREFAAQIARDRTEQRELQAELEQRLSRAAELEETRERLTAELRSAQRSLSEERVVLKQSLKAELDDERAKIEETRSVLEHERQLLIRRHEQDRNEHAARMLELDVLLQAEKKRLTEKVREELAAELSQFNREKQEWRLLREQQKQELIQQNEELQQQREAFGEQLESEQTRMREEVEKRRQMLITEQSNLQRRYRFQFEHLGRAREDLEIEVRELRREQQMFRTDRQRFTEQHRLRFRQLETVRTRLSDVEASLTREARIIERSRAAAMSDIQRLKRRADEEQAAVTQDLDNRERRLRQQETAIADVSAKLEDRSQRLGRLRAELDSTQAEILEQRLATEEVRTALHRDAASNDAVRARLEQARSDVRAFFDRLRTGLNLERDKIEASAADVTERQAQFRRDRAELEQWFTAREAALEQRFSESVVVELHSEIEAQRQELNALQERWIADRREAESSIRGLLDQMTASEMAAVETPPAESRVAARRTVDQEQQRPAA